MNEHTFNKTKEIIAEHLECSYDDVNPETNLYKELGADSLDRVEITMKLEDEFEVEIPDSEMEDVATVEDFVNVIDKAKGHQ